MDIRLDNPRTGLMQLITIIIIIIISKFKPITYHESSLSLTSAALPPGKIPGCNCNNNNNNNNNNNTLIDVAIPADRNVMQKEAEKKLKHKSLCIEMQRMWNLKCTTVPVIIGATGIVTRSLKKNLETIPGKHSIDSLQKTAVLGTSHIIRKVLQCEA